MLIFCHCLNIALWYSFCILSFICCSRIEFLVKLNFCSQLFKIMIRISADLKDRIFFLSCYADYYSVLKKRHSYCKYVLEHTTNSILHLQYIWAFKLLANSLLPIHIFYFFYFFFLLFTVVLHIGQLGFIALWSSVTL